MTTGAKQLRDGNSQFRHSAWSKSGQIRVNPGKKINWPRPCRAEVRRRRIRPRRWLLSNLPHAGRFQLLSFVFANQSLMPNHTRPTQKDEPLFRVLRSHPEEKSCLPIRVSPSEFERIPHGRAKSGFHLPNPCNKINI